MFNFKQFFEKRQYQIKQKTTQNNFNIYKTITELWKKDYIILSVESFHSEKEQSEILGLKILYERFCGKDTLFCNPLFLKEYMRYNQEHYGYDFDKDEQQILTHYQTKIDKATSEFYYNFIQQGILINRIIEGFVENRKYIGIPYKNINDKNDIYYFDPRIIQRVNQEKAICSGETFDEALLNGSRIWTEELGKIFFFTEQLNNLQLHKIPTKDNFITFDLSYNFNIPLLLGVYIDQLAKSILFAFSSSFNFDIAYNQLKINLFKQEENIQLPQPIFNKLNSYLQLTISDNLLYNYIEESSFNTAIFSLGLSIEEEAQLYKQLFTKLNLKLYYRNESLSNNYYVLTLYSLNIHLQALKSYYYLTVQHDGALYDLNEEYTRYIYPNLYRDIEELRCTKHEYYDPMYNLTLLYADISYPLFKKNSNLLHQILEKDYSEIKPGNIFYKSCQKVLTTIEMLHQGKTTENIEHWFKMLNIPLASQDLYSNKWVPDEIVQYIYFLPLQDFLKNEYPSIVESLIIKDK